MDHAALLERLETVITPVLLERGFELVDLDYVVEHGRRILRVRIDYVAGSVDGQGAITVGDCARVSSALHGVLDVEGGIHEAYTLEVSSPGLDRPLRKHDDFVRFAGREIQVQTQAPIEGRRNFRGVLEGVAATAIQMIVDQVRYAIPLMAIRRARLCLTEVLPKQGPTRKVH